LADLLEKDTARPVGSDDGDEGTTNPGDSGEGYERVPDFE
jgi:hypothetical protein